MEVSSREADVWSGAEGTVCVWVSWGAVSLKGGEVTQGGCMA